MLPSFPLLCRAYTEAEARIFLPTVQARPFLIDLAFRSLRNTAPEPSLCRTLLSMAQEPSLKLEPRQVTVLCWFGACTVAGWNMNEAWALDVASRSLAAARSTWCLAPWQPWMGTRPGELPRSSWVRHALEETQAEEQEEYDYCTLEPHRDRGSWEWYTVRQVLEGLDHWQMWLQERFNLPLGVMARTGRPHLPALGRYPLQEERWIQVAFSRAA